MQLALRPYVTAGVALVGTSLIAVTPVAPPPLELQQRAVQLTTAVGADLGALAASGDPTQAYPVFTYGELFTNTLANLQGLGTEFLANPFPVLAQLGTNLTDYAQTLGTGLQSSLTDLGTGLQGLPAVLETAFTDLSSGDVFTAWYTVGEHALSLLLLPLLPTGDAINSVSKTIVEHITAVQEKLLTVTVGLIAAPLYPPFAAGDGAAGVTQGIVTALGAGDFATVLSNIFYAPSTILGAALNGYPEGPISPIGILTNPSSAIDPYFAGSIQNILSALDTIAKAITPAPASAAAAADPGAAADPSAALADLGGLLNGSDLTSLLGGTDLTALLDPGAFAAMFDPADITSALSTLAADIPTMLLNAL